MEAKGGRKRNRRSGGGGTTVAVGAVERKEVERKRRSDMKYLCFKLGSLIPKEHSSKDVMTQFGSLDDAAAYIKKLKERVDELQRRRSSAMQLMASLGGATGGGGCAGSDRPLEAEEVPAPAAAPAVVEVRQHDDSLEVVLVCSSAGTGRPFKFHEVVAVLEEEGADIVSANYSVAGDKTFCTIHSRAFSSKIGIEVSRVSERLRALSKSGHGVVPSTSYDPRIRSPMSSLVQQSRRDWSALGNKNNQIIPCGEIIPAKNAHHNDMGRIHLSNRKDDVSTQPFQLAYSVDDATLSYPHLPTVPEEPSSSFSEDAEHDLLLGVDWLQAMGQAFPEWELQASGYPNNGTTCGVPLF